MRLRILKVVTGIVLVAACSSTPGDLEQSTPPMVREYPENYQEIYRRVSMPATRCWSSSLNAYATLEVDRELYSDLGFGEVSLSLRNMGTRNYYVSARVEAVGDSSRLTVHSGNTLASASHALQLIRWADGDDTC